MNAKIINNHILLKILIQKKKKKLNYSTILRSRKSFLNAPLTLYSPKRKRRKRKVDFSESKICDELSSSKIPTKHSIEPVASHQLEKMVVSIDDKSKVSCSS